MQANTVFEVSACLFSTLALSASLLTPSQRILHSSLFLPLYAAGMIQWALYGLWANKTLIAVTSLAQILICAYLLLGWFKVHKP